MFTFESAHQPESFASIQRIPLTCIKLQENYKRSGHEVCTFICLKGLFPQRVGYPPETAELRCICPELTCPCVQPVCIPYLARQVPGKGARSFLVIFPVSWILLLG